MNHCRLELCDDSIRYWVDGTLAWELSVSVVCIIGEATNDHGPFLDDYFLCFATDADSWFEASFYAEGRHEFLKSLAVVHGGSLTLRLVGSTDYASNVLWPFHLAGTPMFSFKPAMPATWLGRLIGPMRNTQRFSEEVVAELRGGSPGRQLHTGA
jgi:hypothetical protein